MKSMNCLIEDSYNVQPWMLPEYGRLIELCEKGFQVVFSPSQVNIFDSHELIVQIDGQIIGSEQLCSEKLSSALDRIFYQKSDQSKGF